MEERELLKYDQLTQADSIVDNAVTFFKQLENASPEWKTVLDELIEQAIVTKGKIQALRDTITDDVKQLLDEGKEEGQKQLNSNFVEQEISDDIDEDYENDYEKDYDEEQGFSAKVSLGGEEDVLNLLNL